MHEFDQKCKNKTLQKISVKYTVRCYFDHSI